MDRPSIPVEALLFDLGGVLIDIDFSRALEVWQRHSALPAAAVAAAFRFDEAYQRHERGEIDAEAYFRHLARELHIEPGHPHIAAGWNAVFLDAIEETVALVQAARDHLPCYAFTNTNAAHMAEWVGRFPQVSRAFDGIFASHELGLRKPDAAAFAAVVRAIGAAPRSIVFFDDLAENVRAAEGAGLRGVHVRSPADVRRAVRDLGLPPEG